MFVENFRQVPDTVYKGCNVYEYLDYGSVPGVSSLDFAIIGTRKDKWNFSTGGEPNNLWDDPLTGKPYCVCSVPDDLLNDLVLTELAFRVRGASLAKFLEITDILDGTSLSIIAQDPEYTVDYIKIHGYSKGDAAYIVYSPKLLQDAWGNSLPIELLEVELDKTCTQLFYELPIYGSIYIEEPGVTGETEEFMYSQDEYKFERDKWITETLEDYLTKYPTSKLTREMLEKVVPKEPDYQ
jgi:hypothetical protein